MATAGPVSAMVATLSPHPQYVKVLDPLGEARHNRSHMKPPLTLRALGVCLVLTMVVACSESEPPPSPAAETGPSVPPGHVVIGELPDIDMRALLEHTKRLSSDQFEGRLPGTRGEELTVAYLIDQFRKIGLKPG